MIIFFSEINIPQIVGKNIYFFGLNGKKHNCNFTDADFGYSLIHNKIGIFSGYLGLADLIASIPQEKRPESIFTTTIANPIINIDSNHVFLRKNVDQINIDESIKKINEIKSANFYFASVSETKKFQYLNLHEQNFLNKFNFFEQNLNEIYVIKETLYLNSEIFLGLMFTLKKIIGESLLHKKINGLEDSEFSVMKISSYLYIRLVNKLIDGPVLFDKYLDE